MRCKIIVGTLSAVIGLNICNLAFAQISEDVYVDLSVLDSLGTPEISAVNGAPLFPVVKADKAVVKPSPKKQKAAKLKKAKVVKAKKDITADKKKVLSAAKNVSAQQEVIEKAKAAPVVPVKQQIESEVVAQVEPVEPISPVAPQSAVASGNSTVKTVLEEKNQALSDNSSAEEEKIIVVDVEPLTHPVQVVEAEPVKSPAAASSSAESNPETVQKNIQTSGLVSTEAENQDTSAAPVVKDTSAPVQPAEAVAALGEVDRQLQFAADVSELTSVQQAQVDKIIAAFEDAHLNKIAIFAFNVDDGVDSFKKKRLSLNRAIEVRSYLLQKGYKNFSIKVVNVDAGSEKANTVTIEELK